MDKPNAILYTRVSSERQVENTSLDEQEKYGKQYCDKKGLHLVSVFREEGESAKTDDRTQLKNALAYCSSKKNDIKFFLVYRYDRFSRSVEHHHSLKAALSNWGVRVVSMTEEVDDSPEGKFLENILAAVAQLDNDNRSVKSSNGMKAILEQGLWPFPPPYAYIKGKENINKVNPLIPDPERFDLIKKGWQMMLTGRYKSVEIVKELNNQGCTTRTGKKMTEGLISRVFNNPFYAGQINCPKFNIKEIEGKHMPMISIEEFYRVQKIISDQSTSKKVPHSKYNPDFPLNKIIYCTHCGRVLTGSWAKKHLGLGYYRCLNSECNNRDGNSKDGIEESFIELLRRIKPTEKLQQLFRLVVKDVFENKLSEKVSSKKTIEQNLRKLEEQKVRIEELLEQGVYDVDKYRLKISKISPEIETLKINISETNIEIYDLETYVNYALQFINNLPDYWLQLPPEAKHKLNWAIFPKGLKIQNGKVTTDELASIYTDIQEIAKHRVTNGGPSEI